MPDNILVMIEHLSPREQDVLDQMALGQTNPEIAVTLFVTPATVRTHVSNIIGKLVVTNRTEAVLKAQQLGLVDVVDSLSPTAKTVLMLLQLDPSAVAQLVDCGMISLDGTVMEVRAKAQNRG